MTLERKTKVYCLYTLIRHCLKYVVVLYVWTHTRLRVCHHPPLSTSALAATRAHRHRPISAVLVLLSSSSFRLSRRWILVLNPPPLFPFFYFFRLRINVSVSSALRGLAEMGALSLGFSEKKGKCIPTDGSCMWLVKSTTNSPVSFTKSFSIAV